jgi:hypothetical protein
MEDDAVLLADDEEMGALTASTLQGSPPVDGAWQGDAAAAASPPIDDMVMVEQMDVISAAPAEDAAAEAAPAQEAAAEADMEGAAAAAGSQDEAVAPAAAGSDAAAAGTSGAAAEADAGADNGMSANPFAPSSAADAEAQQHGSDASSVPVQQEGTVEAAPVPATSNSGPPLSAAAQPAAEGSSSSEACGGIKAHWQGKSHPVQVPDEF